MSSANASRVVSVTRGQCYAWSVLRVVSVNMVLRSSQSNIMTIPAIIVATARSSSLMSSSSSSLLSSMFMNVLQSITAIDADRIRA